MLKITGVAGDRYNVLDTDDMTVIPTPVAVLVKCKGVGIDIIGCHYERDYFVTEIDGKRHSKLESELEEVWLPLDWIDLGVWNSISFEVSNFGRVREKDRSLKKDWSIVKPLKRTNGYYVIVGQQLYAVHDLVVRTFMPSDIEQGQEVTHLDGNVYNNRVDNLCLYIIKNSDVDMYVSGFSVNGKVYTVVSYVNGSVVLYDYASKESVRCKLDEVIQLKASGALVEGAVYTGDGLQITCFGNTSSQNIECFKRVRFAGRNARDCVYKYEVSNLGNIRRCKAGTTGSYMPVSTRVSENGLVADIYISKLMDDVEFTISELVASTFVPKRTPTDELVRLSDNIYNVSADSFGWCSEKGLLTDKLASESVLGIRCYDMTGRCIAECISLEEAVELGITGKDFITKCAEVSGVVKSRNRCYAWRYVKNDNLSRFNSVDSLKKLPKSVIRQYSCKGDFVSEYASVSQAAKQLNLDAKEIIASCRDKTYKTLCGDSIWFSIHSDSFYSLTVKERRDHLHHVEVRRYEKSGKLIATYSSVLDASEKVGLTEVSISNACANKTKILGGSLWRLSADDELYRKYRESNAVKDATVKIRQYDRKGNFVKEYSSIYEIPQSVANHSAVRRICEREKGVYYTADHIWRYSTDDELYDLSPEERIKVYRKLSPMIMKDGNYKGWGTPSEGFSPCFSPVADKTPPQLRGVVEELQKWYLTIQSQPVGEMERWAPVPLVNYKRRDGSWFYEVSDRGRVRHSDFIGYNKGHYDGKVLQLVTGKTVSPSVSLYNVNGIVRRVRVDRLVAIAFVPNPGGHNSVIHLDGDLNNCRYDNLSWGSQFAEKAEEPIEPEVVTRTIRQYNKVHELVAEYNSITEAAEAVQCSTLSIRKCCSDKFNMSKDFFWRYSDDDELTDSEKPEIDMSEEIWRDVSLLGADLSSRGTYARYQISNFGRLRRPSYTNSSGVECEAKMLKLSVRENGYTIFHFSDAKHGSVTVAIDLIVATEFVPNPDGYDRIKHIDGDLRNNRADNLIWSKTGKKRHIKRMNLKVRQYTLDGEFVKEFSTYREAATSVGCDVSAIQNVCESAYAKKTVCGYVWRLSDSADISGVDAVTVSDGKRPVRKYSLDGEFLDEFDSGVSAAESVGLKKNVIYSVCRGEMVKAGGFMWRYADDDDLAGTHKTVDDVMKERSENYKTPVKAPNPRTEIRQYSADGKVVGTYQSAYKASEATGIVKSSILSCCHRKAKGAKGFVFRYVQDDEFAEMSVKDRAKLFERMKVKASNRGRRCRQYTLAHEFVGEYDNITIAGRETGTYDRGIASCCNRENAHNTAGGFIWRWVDDDEFFSG